MTKIDETLKERGSRYGDYMGHARVAQRLQDVVRDELYIRPDMDWQDLDYDMREALTIIFDKIGRIVNGDPWYADSWHDIAGYATLIDERLENER